MKTVSQPKAAELVKAGWVEKTYFVYAEGERMERKQAVILGLDDLLPAPTADEIAEGVSLEDMKGFYRHNGGKLPETWLAYNVFSIWLYTTRNSADAMAEVWIAVHGKEAE